MTPTLELLRHDVRVAWRSLRKTPVFAAAAALALALGIGATTAMLSVVDAVLVRPLPYADASRLVVLLHNGRNPVAPANFADWRRETRSFIDLAAAEYWTPALASADAPPEQVNALRVTSGMLPLLGVPPLIGRAFTPDEEVAGHERVAVLSYGLWQRRFAGNRDVVGRRVTIDGNPFTIVGVMPATFQFAPFWATHAELWAPLALGDRLASRDGQSLRIFARLRPGITLAEARSDVASVTARLEREYPGTNRDVQVVPLRDKVVGDIRTPLVVLLVGVALVLLIACANVAHLLLARGAAREKELAVRTALGATRARLVTQLLVESGLLAIGGGIGGLLLAVAGVRALVAAAPAIIPRFAHVAIDVRVLFMSIALTAVTALAFGLLPALRGASVDVAEAFRDGDRGASDGRRRQRTRALLVASEFALATVLLAGAGLMMRSVVALGRVDPGWNPSNVVAMSISTVGTSAADSTRHAAFFADALARVRALPGVESASYINHLPIAGDVWGFPFTIAGQPRPRPGEAPTATYRVVFPGYFHTMRIPIVRGRDIGASDREGAQGVAVVNEYLAARHWPRDDALGKRITVDGSTFTIVGIAKNDVRDSWSAPPEEEMFLPFYQQRAYVNGAGPRAPMTLVARVACRRAECDAGAIAPAIEAAVRGVNPNVPISAVQTMSSVVAGATAESRFYLTLLGAFASIAVLLAGVGVYGVMSYSVSRRTREIGLRIALGAEPNALLRGIVRQGVALAATGASAGVVAGLLLTRLMSGLLYGVAPTDAVTFVVVPVTLCAVALVAALVPARRATKIDPLVALRAE